MELPPWPKKADPWMQRTAWILTIIYTSLMLVTHFVIPYYEVFLVLPNLGLAAWYAHSWRKNKYFLTDWWIQYIAIPTSITCLWEQYVHFKQPGIYNFLVGCSWGLPAAAWSILSMMAARERDNVLWSTILKMTDTVGHLVDRQKSLSERQDIFCDSLTGISDHLTRLTNVQHEMAQLESAIVTGNSARARLVELYHEDTTRLAANTAETLGIDKCQLLSARPPNISNEDEVSLPAPVTP